MNRKTIVVLSVCCSLSVGFAAESALAQEKAAEKPSEVLTAVLVAACRQNAEQFAKYQTQENAEVFLGLKVTQQLEIMKRFVQVGEVGRPLLANDAEGRTIVRCQVSDTTALLHFGAERVKENLAFVPVEINQQRRAEFGMVREAGSWKVLSLGLLLFNLTDLARQWKEQEETAVREENEKQAIEILRAVCEAILRYQRAFAALPDRLEQLGPQAEGQGVSPQRANLLDAELAGGRKGDYTFAYARIPAQKEGESVTFALTATPAAGAGQNWRSFYLDGVGVLRGADKKGAAATKEDPIIVK